MREHTNQWLQRAKDNMVYCALSSSYVYFLETESSKRLHHTLNYSNNPNKYLSPYLPLQTGKKGLDSLITWGCSLDFHISLKGLAIKAHVSQVYWSNGCPEPRLACLRPWVGKQLPDSRSTKKFSRMLLGFGMVWQEGVRVFDLGDFLSQVSVSSLGWRHACILPVSAFQGCPQHLDLSQGIAIH